jgi:hypothetical protein
MGGVFMSSRNEEIYGWCQEVINGKLSIKELSILNQKSYRQSQRILERVKALGMLGVKHGNSGKVPKNKTSSDIEEDIRSLLKNDYYDFNLTHFREMLLEKEGMTVGKNIIHRIATRHGLVKKARRRSNKKIHKPRARLPNEGMMVQFDGSVHPWFGEIICDLIGGIDDASGKIVGLEFFQGETSLHCMKVMKDITMSYGVPSMYYLDGAGYFGKVDRDVETQIGRALEQLGARVTIAGSSQAKGKIERLWQTLQDRLVAELRFYQITTMEEANKFLKEIFIPMFNEKFSVPPREKESHFKKPIDVDLEKVFCRKVRRKVNSSHSFSFEGETYVLMGKETYHFRSININTHIDGSRSFDVCGRTVRVQKASEFKSETMQNTKKAA